jgi:hypothetical protein
MANERELWHRVKSLFGEGPETELTRRLIGFLSAHTDTSHISFQLVRQLAPPGDGTERDRSILRTLQFLSGDEVKLLEIKYELFDEIEGVHDLSDEEAQSALTNKVDPITGNPDPNIAERVGLYFSPTPGTIDMLSQRTRS